MRPGGIQDVSFEHGFQSPVDTHPVTVYEKLPMPAAKRLTKADADKLTRVMMKIESLRPKLEEACKVFYAPNSPYHSVAFVKSLIDTTRTLRDDVKAINLLLEHKEDAGTAKNLHTRVKDHLRFAERKLEFVLQLEQWTASHKSYMETILGADCDDDATFFIRVR